MKDYKFKLMTFCFFLAMPGRGSPGKSFIKNYSFLTIFAAATRFLRLVTVSFSPRVLSPQSGFIQSFCFGT